MQGSTTSQAQPATSAALELISQLSGQTRSAQRPDGAVSQLLASLSQQQQQGGMNTGMNMGDPGQPSQLWNLQQLMQTAASQGWAGAMAMNRSKQQSQTLEALLSSISQQPELARDLPSLLSQLGGNLQAQQPQANAESALQLAQPDPGQGSLVYGAPASSGLGSESDAKGTPDAGDMAATGSMDDPALSKANSAKCAKEKNRQAQRRFRERQKGLIQALKERADSLQKQVDDQRRQIETLEKENQVLKVILQEKNKS